jgi:hypothetical protein
MTATPKLIQIQTAAPRARNDGGAVAIAYYVTDNKKVTLTDRDGNVLHDAEGKDYSRTLAENDSAHQIAALLLRQLKTKVRGDRVAGFDRPLVYPKGWGVPY